MGSHRTHILPIWLEMLAVLLNAGNGLHQNQLIRKTGSDNATIATAVGKAKTLDLIEVKKVGGLKMISLTRRGCEVAEHVRKIKEIVEVSEFSVAPAQRWLKEPREWLPPGKRRIVG